jgi:signal transduction histidine kinase
LIITQAEKQMRRDADARLRMSNQQLATNLSTWIELNANALETLVRLDDIASMDAVTQRPVLVTMHQTYPYMYLVSTTDLNGMNVARNDEADLTDYSDRIWFQQARAGNHLTYQTLVGRTTGLPALVVSAPIHNENNEIIGVGMFAADLTNLTREVQVSTLGDTGFTFVVDRNNQAVAHPKADYTNGLPDLSDENAVEYMRSGGDGITSFTDSDGVRWRAYVHELDNGWGVIVQQREDEVLEPVRGFANLAWITLVIGGVLLIPLLWLVIGRSLGPIRQLTETAQAIAGGELNRSVTIHRQDEIGVLANTFNSMTTQLRDLINNLESRVTARTRDLELGAEVSRQITTVLDIDTLVEQVTVQTAKSFDLYQVFVFLYQEEKQKLVRMATEQELIIPLDANPSIIALTARSRKTVLENDVINSRNYLKIEGLSETRSELTIPMLLGNKLIGVFDIQASTVDRFKEDDVRILTALAEQVTIAIRNAQLFAETTAARQDAERSNAVKSQFLASMSHELRTPLNAILNFTQFVSSGMMGPVNERQENALKKTVASGEHLLSLINDVLDISKIEANALQLFMEDNVDVKPELEAAIETGKGLIKDKPVELTLYIENNLPCIHADRQRVYQIVLNLVSNACKFTEKGSINVQACHRDHHILITVRDTGPGIASDDQAVIFEAFRQSHSGLQKGGGTGLGLPISKRLAEAHGGTVWVESEEGHGATFYVSLPISTGA